MPNIQLIVAAVIFTIIAGLAGTVYVQHLENSAKTAEIAQQAQALAVQKETISNLTAQAAEIAVKHEQLNAAYAAAEQRLQQRVRQPAPVVGGIDSSVDSIGSAIERAGR